MNYLKPFSNNRVTTASFPSQFAMSIMWLEPLGVIANSMVLSFLTIKFVSQQVHWYAILTCLGCAITSRIALGTSLSENYHQPFQLYKQNKKIINNTRRHFPCTLPCYFDSSLNKTHSSLSVNELQQKRLLYMFLELIHK